MRSVRLLPMLLLLAVPLARGQVKVWEGAMQLASSDEGPPDENPPFGQFSELENYPYTMRTVVRATETIHNFRAVYLENEYLKCTVLPDVGGHLYTCVDKLNNTPMFYANPTLKKALVAYRGAWSAFGVEFNFPVSHNWVTISPVDFAYSKAADGSASITVGNRDRVYGMDWTVQLILRPGSTVLEERVTLANHTDLRHHYFWWNNGAVQVWDNSRILYPMQFTTDQQTWPIDAKGVDQSLIANQTAGEVSLFAFGTREPFMGVYNPHTNAGVVHYAEHAEVPAQKIWSWGVDAADLEWRHTLSDNNSAYVEVQGGLFKDQDTYGFLEPAQAVHFSEYWMPVRDIGTISRATLDGIVAITRESQPDGKIALKIGFNATHTVPTAKITVSDGTTTVYEETATLDPAKSWIHRIEALPAEKKYTILIADDGGKPLLKHTEETYDITPREQLKPDPPHTHPSEQKNWTDADFVTDGADHEMSGDYLGALDRYTGGLAKDPSSLPLLKSAGRLAISQFRFEEAAKYLAQAEERNPWDPEIHYYRAIAESALAHPDTKTVHEELDAANRSPEFRIASGVLLAEMLAQKPDSAAALKQLADSCPPANSDLRCVEDTVALERSTGDTVHAKTLAGEAGAEFPTSIFLQNESAKLGHSVPGLDLHLAADTSRILNLVIQYNRLGLYADSLELLSRAYPTVPPEQAEPDAVTPSNDALLAYYRAFTKQKLGQPAQADSEAASRLPLLYIFPNHAEDFAVLRTAITTNASDASAHFLLGALLFSKGIVDPALGEWTLAESLNPRIPSLEASMGRTLLEIKKQPAAAVAVLERGLTNDPANAGLYLQLNEAMRQTSRKPLERAQMMERFPNAADMPPDFIRAFVDTLREADKNEEANAVLAGHFLPRKEGEQPLQPSALTK